MPPSLDAPITAYHPYAKRLARPLARLGIVTVRDLLEYLPTRHEDLRAVIPIRDARIGQHVVFHGRVVVIANRRSPRQRLLLTEALIADATGSIRCVWFRQSYLPHAFPVGAHVALAGTVRADGYGLHLDAPLIETLRDDTLHTGRIIPMYPLTSGISQKQLRVLVHAALPCAAEFPETLAPAVLARERFPSRAEAVREVHFPTTPEALARARERFAFEEVFTYLLRVRASREACSSARAPEIPFDEEVTRTFVAGLPFRLTEAQRRAAWEVLRDMSGALCDRRSRLPSQRPMRAGCSYGMSGRTSGGYVRCSVGGSGGPPGYTRPMQRLLNGDVGSGKTVVAAIACANVSRAGYQAAYLAPTEVLAVQQAQSFVRWLTPLGLRVALWTRTARQLGGESVTPAVIARAVAAGAVNVVVGTHAILTPRVHFRSLALAIVDEQHRFGVAQRAALRTKGGVLPHLLSMTATPIPRTLALTLLGDLAVSVLDEFPPGRTPPRTVVVAPVARVGMTRDIRAELDAGRQAFIICSKIDGEDHGDARGGGETAAVMEALDRARRAFPGVAIAALHGRMRRDAQREVMAAFAARQIAVLVATTVVEVGVDVPNASVIVVEDAERFGLAQLHQLRGRVGRGVAPGVCFLTTSSDDPGAHERLARVASCTDGFALAELDLAERGPGAVIGTAQSGWPTFRFATMDPLCFRKAQAAVDETPTVSTPAMLGHFE